MPSLTRSPRRRHTPADSVAAAEALEALAAVVSRETDDREEVASSLPQGDRDTPLARAVAADARKRIALTGRVFPKPPTTRVLTVANQKGGVGKTTTTVNVAAALAQAGLTVLVIDIDPQGNASTALGIDHHAEVPSIYDVLVEGTPLADVVQECPDIAGPVVRAGHHRPGRRRDRAGLPGRPRDPAAEGDRRLPRAGARRTGRPAPDYVLIDCPPSLGLLTVNAFVAAQEVFIPIQCEYYALEGLSQLLKNIELIRNHLNPTLHVSTILLTMYDGRTRLSAQVAEEVRNHFPEQVLRNTVPALGADLRGAEPRPDRDDLRPQLQRRAVLPRRRRRARRPRRRRRRRPPDRIRAPAATRE